MAKTDEVTTATLKYDEIGRRIQNRRKERGLTQERLSELVNISPAHMSHIESGKTKVSLICLVAIANALQTSMDELLYDNVTVLLQSYDQEFRDLTRDCSLKEKQAIYSAAASVRKALKGE